MGGLKLKAGSDILSEFFPKSVNVMTKMATKEQEEEQKWLNSLETIQGERETVEKNADRFRKNEDAYGLFKAAKNFDKAARQLIELDPSTVNKVAVEAKSG